jgi:hypothetical protein
MRNRYGCEFEPYLVLNYQMLMPRFCNIFQNIFQAKFGVSTLFWFRYRLADGKISHNKHGAAE